VLIATVDSAHTDLHDYRICILDLSLNSLEAAGHIKVRHDEVATAMQPLLDLTNAHLPKLNRVQLYVYEYVFYASDEDDQDHAYCRSRMRNVLSNLLVVAACFARFHSRLSQMYLSGPVDHDFHRGGGLRNCCASGDIHNLAYVSMCPYFCRENKLKMAGNTASTGDQNDEGEPVHSVRALKTPIDMSNRQNLRLCAAEVGEVGFEGLEARLWNKAKDIVVSTIDDYEEEKSERGEEGEEGKEQVDEESQRGGEIDSADTAENNGIWALGDLDGDPITE
jgi:hypothetical protein